MSNSSRAFKLEIIKFSKDFLLATRLLQVFQPLNKLFFFLYNFNQLTSWVHKNKKQKYLMNDFYRSKRNYDDRLKSFEAIVKEYSLSQAPVAYLEFGVAAGYSFRWWMEHCSAQAASFHGFDTFEGLPEKWGLFAKGDMDYGVPALEDKRGRFYKGIFQDTLNAFLFADGVGLKGRRKIIHLDADLFSATIFALSQLYPYLEKGDIIMFDEFSVYDHEFMAFKIFTECFYVQLKPISAQNNFYHCAFEVI